jgi:predicted ATP-dependent protease
MEPSLPTPLPVDALYRRCNLSGLAFETTGELAAPSLLIGQERARDAVKFGMGMRAGGYNVFVLGPAGMGRRTLVRQTLLENPPPIRTTADWCYVHNFRQPHRPRALQLPARRAGELRGDMREFVEELRAAIPAMFDSEEYRSRSEQIGAQIDERTQSEFEAVGREAAAHDLVLLHTPAGFSFAPVRNGEVVSPEEYAKQPEEVRQRIEAKMEDLQGALQKAIRQAQRLQKERRQRLRDLNREMTLTVVGLMVEDIKHRYPDLPDVAGYLDEVQADVLENIDDFRAPSEQAPTALSVAGGEAMAFHRYDVNVIIGDEHEDGQAPIVVEDYPTYQNLLGRIEHVARFGTLVTDFTLIKSGALHRANGGYLLLDAHKLLSQPFAWDGLKRALSSKQIRTESLGQTYGLVSTAALEPEPIPLDVKVILFGERYIYYLLLALDPEFGELFKIAADFEDDIPRSASTEMQSARLIAALGMEQKLLPFERAAVARIIEHGARLSGDAEHLSAHLGTLIDLLRESEQFAREGGAQTVSEQAVDRALAEQERRANRIQQRMRDATLRGELLIDTDSAKVGQVNGLSVSIVGRYAFGHPSRITATSRVGSGEVIDIAREVDMGGAIHSKGVLILGAFLASRFSRERPHSLLASLAFEQTYGEVEGDSASVAELCALLSSLSDVPLRQSIAVTGSVNQHGMVQPVGSINEKIEGFFDLCEARGLTGGHGVLIPAANISHLMLKRKVVEAARADQFRIYACRTVDEAIELLTGVPAGTPDQHGQYPPDSINFRVASRLDQFSALRQTYSQGGVTVKTIRKTEKAPPPAPEKR